MQQQMQPQTNTNSKHVKKPSQKKCKHTKVGLLFSGGLDSAILALLMHSFVPPTDAIDLINVAFEVPQRTSDKNITKK